MVDFGFPFGSVFWWSDLDPFFPLEGRIRLRVKCTRIRNLVALDIQNEQIKDEFLTFTLIESVYVFYVHKVSKITILP